jgi:hypothetical protein
MGQDMDPNLEPVTRGVLREELRELRHELSVGLRDALHPIYAILANHTVELAEIRHHIKTELVTKSEFHARMDGFAKRVPS